MYSWTFRANSIFTFAVTVMGVLAGLNAASVFFQNPQPTLNKLAVVELQRPRGFQHSRNAGAIVKFDLDADLEPMWNWNVKLLFLYVTAEFSTATNSKNQIVLWDHMVKAKEYSHVKHDWDANVPRIHVKGTPFEYPLQDQGKGLWDNTQVTLALNWCVMPVVGPLYRGNMSVPAFMFPRSWQEMS
mmetsp:Transcript_2360/g.5590  ORF Transcript_2360/g.5590 Transcript_2360/m.5590 type:complete len:186 (+) Transcript_2360:3-560(+)